MRSLDLKRFLGNLLAFRSSSTSFLSLRCEGSGCSPGLKCALAGKGVLVNDKAFQNLTASELQQKGATIVDSLAGVRIHVRGDVLGRSSDISKAQYSKLLKQVTAHLSSISNLFLHDGAIGCSMNCDTNVRVISDNPSAVFKLSSILWKTNSRAISHDSCPLTVYVATSISSAVGDAIGIGAKGNHGFIAADVERSSLILCDKAFSDINGVKKALAALCGPIISARGGLLLPARLLVLGNSSILLFAPEETIQTCADQLVSADAGVIFSSDAVSPLFRTSKSCGLDMLKMPAALIVASSDSSGVIPSAAKISSGQAAYHFLVGYQNGKFVPAYCEGPSSIDALDLAMALLSKLNDHQIPIFLINVKKGKTSVTSEDLMALVQSTISKNVPPFEPKGGDLQEKYQKFIRSKFQEIPRELSF